MQAGNNAVRALRARLGMTQQDFAQALDVAVSTVSKWERGLVKPHRIARSRLAEMEALVRRMERKRQSQELSQ